MGGFYGTTYLTSKGNHKYAVKVQELVIHNIEKGKIEASIAKKMGDIGVGPKIYESYFCTHNNKIQLFMVQEYMSGGTLENWLSDGNKFTPKLKKELKDKVKMMHKHGYYHLDLKNDNILIQNKNGKPELYLGDFGLSKTKDTLTSDALLSDNNDIKFILTGKYGRIKDNQLQDLVIDDMIYNERIKIKF